jgi:hypothetical protein
MSGREKTRKATDYKLIPQKVAHYASETILERTGNLPLIGFLPLKAVPLIEFKWSGQGVRNPRISQPFAHQEHRSTTLLSRNLSLGVSSATFTVFIRTTAAAAAAAVRKKKKI